MTQQTDRLNTALDGRYRIERHLGEGGMATVYLCEDMKHDRKVALKLLKPELAAVLGAERFVQEIKTTAALQHPHILPLFDSGSADGFLFYVMPYIQGETLREKLNRETQLGVDEAVRIARDVADALDYAHRHGVIHRDIKPENILMHDGRPMVADFGIALALSAAAGGRMTESGLSLGTPYYMSPEQATAEKEITARSDIYSIGSVLYEMLTGEPPHIGGSAQAIIMKIVTDRARPVTDIRKAVPHHVAAAVAKSIEKLPADRFESAAKFAEALANPAYTNATFTGTAVGSAAGSTGKLNRPLIATATLAALLLVAALWGWMRPQPAADVQRFDLALGVAAPSSDVAISPDGKMLAYAGTIGGQSAIYLRHLDGEPDFRLVPGTDGGLQPAFSPDNQWIVFRRSTDQQIAKVTVSGGGATPLTSGADAYYPQWAVQDRILHAGPAGTFIVSSDGGGPPSPNLRFDGRRPFMLPDGSGVLGVRGGDVVLTGTTSDSAIVLVKNATHPTYSRSGHLLYLSNDGGLFAVPFDLKRHRVTGAPVRVLDNVAYSLAERGYALSDAGTLVHHQGPPASGTGAVATRLVIRRFAGGADTLPLPAGNYVLPRVSPNGRFVAYSGRSSRGTDFDIYTFDIQTGTNTQITFDGNNRQAIWSPDGKRLVFDKESGAGKGRRIFVKSADNSGTEVKLLEQKGDQLATGWPREDLLLLQSNDVPIGPFDLFTMSPTKDAKPQAYLHAPYDKQALTLSPDGKLAAFVARETGGAADIWIRDFPTPAGKWKAGPGGNWPRWSPDGRYVYFWRAGTPNDTLFRAQVDRAPAVVVRAPEIVEVIDAAGLVNWDLFPDGKRYILAVAAASAATTSGSAPGSVPASRYVIVKNWFAELKAKTAPKK